MSIDKSYDLGYDFNYPEPPPDWGFFIAMCCWTALIIYSIDKVLF